MPRGRRGEERGGEGLQRGGGDGGPGFVFGTPCSVSFVGLRKVSADVRGRRFYRLPFQFHTDSSFGAEGAGDK